ncbi:hypothetical protein lerEdw1_006884, partial [Lerista edwardsae]
VANHVHQQYANLETSQVVLHCPILEGTSLVEWRVNGTKGPILKEGGKDGNLVLQNISLVEEGEYSCHEPNTGQVLWRVHLHLGYPPDKPSVWCWSISYLSVINCTWKLESETHLNTSFFSTYRYGMEGEKHECIQPIPGADSCSITDIQMFSNIPYMLNVTAVNPLGTATNLFPVFLNQISEFTQNPNLSLPQSSNGSKLPSDTPKCATVTAKVIDLKNHLPSHKGRPDQTRILGPVHWDQGRPSPETNPLEQTSFILTGIRPRATYYAQVAAKDFLDHGEYSAWSSPAFGAAWVPE